MVTAFRAGLEILPAGDRRKLLALLAAQVSLGILDLAGVATLGAVVLLVATTASGSQPSGLLGQLTEGLPTDLVGPMGAVWLAIAAAVLLVVKSALSFLLTRATFKFLAREQARIASSLAERLLGSDLLLIQRRSSQERAMALTRAVSQLTLGVLGNSVVLIADGSLLVLLIGFLVWVDLPVTIFAILFFSLVAMSVHFMLSNWVARVGETSYDAELKSLVVIQEAIRSFREIFVLDRRRHYARSFRHLRSQAAGAQADRQLLSISTKYVYEVALVCGGAVLALSQFLTRDVAGALTVLAVFLVAASRMLPSIMRMQAAALTIRSSAPEGLAAVGLHEELEAVPVRGSGASDPRVGSRLELERRHAGREFVPAIDVSSCTVRYDGHRRPSLDSVSLRVDPGTSIAVVGMTGAGKSTLADVILGIVHPESGQILLGGVPPREAIALWPGSISYVPQEVAIIDGTVRDNVTLGLDERQVNDAQVSEALRQAQILEFFLESRSGLETRVGESGVRLSGGQRQRLGLARALYTRPRVLVLDEATSALDAQTEHMISETLTELAGKVTLVVVAHRLSTVKDVDQVAYLEDGRLVAVGNFEELVRSIPQFEMQAVRSGLYPGRARAGD